MTSSQLLAILSFCIFCLGERGHDNADAIKRVRDVLNTALTKSAALCEAARGKRIRISRNETTASASFRNVIKRNKVIEIEAYF